MNAHLRPRTTLAAVTAVGLVVCAWSVHHVLTLVADGGRVSSIAFAVSFGLLALQLGLAYAERPAQVSARTQRALDRMSVAAVVPVFNEDPGSLWESLQSIIGQRRKPAELWVVDDGSTAAAYDQVRAHASAAAAAAGVEFHWLTQPNRGKRHAQVNAMRRSAADVYWTSDSDTVHDPAALDELLKPLADHRVASVAGIVLAANVRRSFLTRFTDLWFVAGQLTDRSSLSRLGSVWVNSGPIAVYRGDVIRRYFDAYLAETFMGLSVPFSDDSMLTLYSMLEGRTVQQPTAVCFSYMPESFSNHRRQFIRWMRGSFIRSWWRLRYLPLGSVAYWLHLLRLGQTLGALVVFAAVVVVGPVVHADWRALPYCLTALLAVGYIQTLRYMTLGRSDQTRRYQWATWLLCTPVAALWAATFMRAARLWAIATCLRMGWNTRTAVEMSAAPAATASLDDTVVIPATWLGHTRELAAVKP